VNPENVSREVNPEYPEMNDRPQDQDWRILAEEAAEEKDPTKLMEIIRALNRALDEQEERKQPQRDA
jgi:hypothetical protein